MKVTHLTLLRRVVHHRTLQAICIAFLMALAYFSWGFVHLSDYGVTWDEPLHRNWGKLFTVFWRIGDRSAISLMPGNGMYYGPLPYTLNYLFSEWMYSHGLLRFVEANHLLTLIISSITLSFTFLLGRFIGGANVGLLSALFFAFFPQMLGHAHYNPKDVPVMMMVLLTSLVFLYALRNQSRFQLLIAAFLFGLSLSTKLTALLLTPVFALSYLSFLSTPKLRGSFRILDILILCAGACVVILLAAFLSWPSLWGDPMLFLRSLGFFFGPNFWPGKVLYFGHYYSGSMLPWHYIPFSWLSATPFLTLVAFTLGTCSLLYTVRAKKVINTESMFLLLWVFLPLLISIKPGLVRYDGIRQFLFLLPGLCIIAGIGAERLIAFTYSRIRSVPALAVIGALSFASLLHESALTHPFQGSYRNEFLRLAYPKDMDRSHELEYWGPSYRQGMEWLIQNADPNPVICVPTAGILISWYPWREDFRFECGQDSTYIMFFTRYSMTEKVKNLIDPVFTIERMGATLLAIYKVDGV